MEFVERSTLLTYASSARLERILNSRAAATGYPEFLGLTQRLKLQGFIVSEHLALWPRALGDLAAGVATGRIKYRESISQGIESAPAAFLGLLKGKNFGKQLVKLV